MARELASTLIYYNSTQYTVHTLSIKIEKKMYKPKENHM